MADLKLFGKVVEILPQETGTTKQGTQWWSQAYVVEELETNYPERVQFVLYGKHLNEDNVNQLLIGNQITTSFNIKLREWTGMDGKRKSSIELRTWKIEQGNTIEQIKPAKVNQDGEFVPVFAQPTITEEENNNAIIF